jgi:outer membrane murein-binding lipoprotein Lpp
MRAIRTLSSYILLAVCVSGLSGCGKKADENKPISEVKTEAEKMSAKDLRAMAETYRDAIVSKKGEVENLAKKIANIPLAEKLGAEAQALNADMDSLNKSLSALRARFQIYYDKLKEKNGDLSGLEI